METFGENDIIPGKNVSKDLFLFSLKRILNSILQNNFIYVNFAQKLYYFKTIKAININCHFVLDMYNVTNIECVFGLPLNCIFWNKCK